MADPLHRAMTLVTLAATAFSLISWRPSLGDEAAAESAVIEYAGEERIERVIGRVPFQHDDRITGLEWLDDGRSLLTASRQGLTIWEIATGTVIRKIERFGSNDLQISVDRSRTRIAVLADHACPRLIEWPSGRILQEFETEGKAIALSPDGSTIAIASISTGNHGNLKFFDCATGRQLSDRRGPPTLALAWSPDSRMLAAGESRGIVVFLKPDGSLVRPGIRLQRPTVPLALAFDAQGKRLALAGMDGTTGVWRMSDRTPIWVESGELTNRKLLHRRPIGGVCFSHDGSRLYADLVRQFRVFNSETGTPEHGDLSSSIRGQNFVLSSDGKTLACVNSRYGVDFLDSSTLESATQSREDYPYATTGVRVSPDRQAMISLGDRRADFWGDDPLRHIGGIEFAEPLTDACWSRDGRFVAVSRSERGAIGAVDIIDAVERTVLRTLPLDELPQGVAFSADGNQICIAEVNHISCWDVSGSQQLWRTKAGEEGGRVGRLAVSLNGQQVAATVRFPMPGFIAGPPHVGGVVRLFRLDDGQLEGELLTDGIPEQLLYVDDAMLITGMAPFVINEQVPFHSVVTWDLATQAVNPDAGFAFPNPGPLRYSFLSADEENRRLLVCCPDPNATVTTSFAIWDRATGKIVDGVRLPGQLRDAVMLSDNRLAIVRGNGSMAFLTYRDGSEGESLTP